MIRLLAFPFVYVVVWALVGCGTAPPRPTPPPDPYCHPEMMLRAMDHTVHGVQSCYACTGASACTTEGNQWCCADSMCSECGPSLVPWPNARPKSSAVLRPTP